MKKRRMVEKIPMAPSGGCGGGSEVTAFVSPPANRGRTIISSLQSSASSAATSYNNDENNNNDSIFSTRGGHQSHQSTEIQQKQRVLRPDEPNLYDIPSNLHATYQPLPFLVRMLISLSSAAMSWKQFITLTFTVHHRLVSATIKNVMVILVRYLLVSSVAKLCLQEWMSPPSRVTTKYLADNDLLPSRLSRYQFVTPMDVKDVMGSDASEEDDVEKTMKSIGVHSLQYTNPSYVNEANTDQQQHHRRKQQHKQQQHNSNFIDAAYLHHGFGASSLSWLPVLPSLTKQLGARVGVAHDSVGFGFTDRPQSLEAYSAEANVGIGLELLNDVDDAQATVGSSGENEKSKAGNVRNIAIFGHSMGAKAALIMALACSKREDVRLNPSLVVLVAPALEGVSLPSTGSSTKKKASNNKISQLLRSIWVTWRKIFLDYPFRYGLRRLVGGSPNFWRKGLASAWGDPKRLSDSDVLRFQWPSIGMGWEQGLLNLVRSKLSSSSKSVLDDGELLQQVSSLPNTKVVIIYGSRDRIVKFEGLVAEKVKKEFPTVHIVRMEGLGHDPYEEDVDGFLRELKAVV
eukprot:scaffold1448_cov71-Skeletonema_dohrnii-CCMP3373.AAC.2